jgi:ATP-binding protein involved in chromosome partitioning
MSWFQPDKEGRKYYLFGKDGGKQLAEEYSLDLLGQLPLLELEEDKNLMENKILKIEFSSIADKLEKSVKNLKEKKSDGIPQVNISK